MCRSTEIHGFYQPERDRLKIKAFYLRLKVSPPTTTTTKQKQQNQISIPESLTLLYLPRIIINGRRSFLEIDDVKIKPDSPAFVTLYRVRSEEDEQRSNETVVFASRERVRASEGVRFEVYSREEKILKGSFGKDLEEEWRLVELRSVLESEPVGFRVSEAEVCVVVDGHVAIVEKVDVVVRRRKKRASCGFRVLEEIPEEEEEECSCDCCCDDDGSSSDGGYCENDEVDEDDGFVGGGMVDGDGAKWAVDVGIWVMCLGVGYLVTKASSRSLRRRTRILG